MSSLNFSISHEELFLLSTLLKLQSFPGFDPNDFANLSQYELGLVIGTAERSLRAKGYIHGKGSETIEVDPVVVAMMGTCSISDLSFYASCTEPEKDPVIRYYHIHLESKTLVEHKFTDQDLHTFVSMDNKKEIADHISDVLKLGDQKSSDCMGGHIQDDQLKKTLGLVKDPKKGVSILIEGGLDKRTAEEMLITISNPITNGSFLRMDHKVDKIQGFATLEGTNGLWQLTPQEDSAWVSVEPVTGKDLSARLKKIIVE